MENGPFIIHNYENGPFIDDLPLKWIGLRAHLQDAL
jgi:hypothetical protein